MNWPMQYFILVFNVILKNDINLENFTVAKETYNTNIDKIILSS